MKQAYSIDAQGSPQWAPLQAEGLTASAVSWTPEAPAKRAGYLLLKRLFDLISTTLLLVVIWPVLFLIALAIRLDSKGPAVFTHTRIGQNGKPIRLYKFRSMVTNAQELIASFTPEQKQEWEENFKLAHDPRVTRVGRILRKTSLDELPQLLNILRGDLSVVGPRPVVPEELEKYGPYKQRFLSARPGLTGYWQAYARSNCSYEQRMDMELAYAHGANLQWDLTILLHTVFSVVQGRGAR